MGCFFFEFCKTIIEEKFKPPAMLKLGFELLPNSQPTLGLAIFLELHFEEVAPRLSPL